MEFTRQNLGESTNKKSELLNGISFSDLTMKHGVSMQPKKLDWKHRNDFLSRVMEMLHSNLEMLHSHCVTIFCKKF